MAVIVYVKDKPIAVPTRRYPNQTCDDDELKPLEQEKDKLCNSGYAANCTGDRTREDVKKRLDGIPCSAIMLSLAQRYACLKQRNLIEEKCFGGVPDTGHQEAIDNTQRGINLCEALKLINCVAGHPMSNL